MSVALIVTAGAIAASGGGYWGFQRYQLSKEAARRQAENAAYLKQQSDEAAARRAAADAQAATEAEERKRRELEASTPAITDQTASLSQAEKAALQAAISNTEKSTGTHVYVIFTSTTYGEDIRSFALKHLKSRLEADTALFGVVIATATEDKKATIQVSDQLLPLLPESALSAIWSDMAASFGQSKYFEGLTTGIQKLEQAISAAKSARSPGK